jgi:general secretion pathway protein F
VPSFRYHAVSQAGEAIQGVMEAADAALVIAWIQRQGHIPIRADLVAHTPPWHRFFQVDLFSPARLSKSEVAQLTRELAVMLDAGQDLDWALRFVVDTIGSRKVRDVATDLRDRVRSGSSFASALDSHAGSFSALYIGLVRAGEAGGTLAATLDHLASLLERERALAASVQSALLYPAILLVAAIASVALLLLKVLPQFVPYFTQSGMKLPASTRFLIALGDNLAILAPWGFAGLMTIALVIQRLGTVPSCRRAADRLVLRLPILGRLLRETLAARFTRTLGTLLANGVPLVAALGIVGKALGNLEATAVVEAAATKVKTGNGLSGSLRDAGLFPPRCLHLLRLGEETARLSAMALKAAEIHDEQVRHQVQRLVTLMVPAITILMGAMVAGIVSAVLNAMLSLNDLVM